MTPQSRRVIARIMWLALTGLCAAVLSLAGVYLYLDPQVPEAETFRHVKLETPLRVYTADAQLIAEFGERRLIPVTLAEVPPLFVKALLDTEDKRFYQHSGVDYISLLNDTFELLLAREIRSGASTITMQLARNISFSLEQTFIRKFKEMLLALKIEQELTKDEILELYINVVPFGKRAYGAQAGALTYYGTRLENLNLAQLAMLAGIPQAPTAGNPINGPERAVRRRNQVLGRMLAQQSISEDAHNIAVNTPISARLFARGLDVAAPFPAEWVRSELIGRYSDLYTGGYKVHTTIDGELQRTATNALRRGLMSYDRRHGYRGPELSLRANEDSAQSSEQSEVMGESTVTAPTPEQVVEQYRKTLRSTRTLGGLEPAVVLSIDAQSAELLLADNQQITLAMESMSWARPYLDVDAIGQEPGQPSDVLTVGDLVRVKSTAEGWTLAQLPLIQGALVSLNPLNGAVVAMEGGFDFSMNQYNHAMQAARQPGSGFKPFVYSAALANGITPASIYMDAPLVFNDQNLEAQYRPDNDNNRYNGPTRLRQALYRSINLVSMRVLLDITAPAVLDYARKFGFDTRTFPRNTQLAIGGGTMAVTPLDMATAYTVFANGGWRVQPNIIQRVLDSNGDTVFEPRYPVVCDPCETLVSAATIDKTISDTASTGTNPASDPNADIAGSQEPVIPAVRVVDERNAYIMHSMLQDVIRRGTGVRAKQLERSDLAGKTGTTNDAADTWFNGYTPDLVTTVWVGFPNHQPLGAREYGSSIPLPIWMEYMEQALSGKPESLPRQPPGIVTMKIDPSTGARAAPNQVDAIFELFLKEHVPESQRSPIVDESDTTNIKPVDIF
jgi:penicillin-binding protein 1A